MGCVLRASDPVSSRMVAIKCIYPEVLAGELAAEFRERFYREARAAESLSNSGIVALFDVGEDGGMPFWVMELVEGHTLPAAIQQGESYSIGQLCEIGLQVADALGYAHRMGVVHGAIKPSNILMTSPEVHGVERPRITDFGIINPVRVESIPKEQLLGTVGFMSPERLSGARIDGRADLFSLGAVLYWMATGKHPFEGESFAAISFNVMNSKPVPPSKRNPAVPPQLESVILRCLAKNPRDRYASAEELYINLALLRMAAPDSSSHAPVKEPKPTTENSSGENTDTASTLPSQRLRVFAGSAPPSMSMNPVPDEAALPGLAPGKQAEWIAAIRSMHSAPTEIPVASATPEVRKDRGVSSDEQAAAAVTPTITPERTFHAYEPAAAAAATQTMPQETMFHADLPAVAAAATATQTVPQETMFDSDGMRRTHRRIRRPLSRHVVRVAPSTVKQAATVPVSAVPLAVVSVATEPAQQSAAQPSRRRGWTVLLSLLLLSAVAVPAGFLVQKHVTEAARRVPAQQAASVPSVESSLPAAAPPPQILTGSSVSDSPTRAIAPVYPASDEDQTAPPQAQTEAMNEQLNAPKRIPQDAGKAVAELAPPPAGFNTADGEGMGGNIAMGNVFNARPQQVVKALPSGPIRIAAAVASELLVQKNPPVYPQIAKTARVTGTVKLEVTVSAFGTVKDLRVLDGPAMLRGAAADAVRTWRYKPFLSDDQPREFQTTVDIAFTLGG
jgi:TonB family protein